MKTKLLILIFALSSSLIFSQEDKPDTALSLEQLLELVQQGKFAESEEATESCLLYTSPSPRDATLSRMPSSA